MEQKPPKATTVTACRIVVTKAKEEDDLPPRSCYGLKLDFSDKTSLYYPDVMPQEAGVQRLCERLLGREVDPETMPEILEDYLGEVYGVM